MPPKSPIGFSSDQLAPSSSLTAIRTGYKPLKRMTRFFPLASTTRCSVGVSSDVSQLLGVGRRSDHVLPPSALLLYTIAPLPCPLGYTHRLVWPSSNSSVVGWPRYWPFSRS